MGRLVITRSGDVIDADDTAHALLGVDSAHRGPITSWIPEFPVALWPACGEGAVISILRRGTAGGERSAQDLIVEVASVADDEIALRVAARSDGSLDPRSIDAHFDILSRVVGELTHEMNNPLAGIIAALDTTIEFEEISPGARTLIESARAEVLRLAQIVSRARKQSRGGNPELETVQVAGMLESVLGPMRAYFERRAVQVRVEVPAELANVVTDPFRFKSMLVNLTVNARDSLESRGSQLRIRLDRLPADMCPEAPGAWSWLALTVQDDGAGMSRDALLHAGDLLFTTKRFGSGIGLATVRATAASFAGSVLLRSTIGRGTIASVLLREPLG